MTIARTRHPSPSASDRGALYLYAWALLWPATYLMSSLFPNASVFLGLSPADVIGWLLVLGSLLVWPISTRGQRADRWLLAFLGTLAAAWLVFVVQSIVRSEYVQPLSWLLPLILCAIAVRPPSYRSALRATSLFTWSLTVALWCSLILDLAFPASRLAPVSEVVAVSVPCRLPDWVVELWAQGATGRLEIWGLLGLPARWAGFYGNPNALAPMAVMILVYGLWRRGPARLFLLGSGLLFLLLSGSRTSMLAALAGVLVLAVLAPRSRWIPFSRGTRAWVALAGICAVVAFAIARDPDMNGRTSMWAVFGGLWAQSPMWGIGATGFQEAIQRCLMPPTEINAGSLLFDALVRFGVVGAMVATSTIVVGVVVCVVAARRSLTVPLALIVALGVGGLADIPLEWGWPSSRWVGLLVLPVLLAWSWNSERRPVADREVSEELTTPSE